MNWNNLQRKSFLLKLLLVSFSILLLAQISEANSKDSTEDLANYYINATKGQLLTELLITKRDLFESKKEVISLNQDLIIKNNIIIGLEKDILGKNDLILQKNNQIKSLLNTRYEMPKISFFINLGYDLGFENGSFSHGLNLIGQFNLKIIKSVYLFCNMQYSPNFYTSQYLNFKVSGGLGYWFY